MAPKRSAYAPTKSKLIAGTVLCDAMKRSWRVGKHFATGGMGTLYDVTLVDSGSAGTPLGMGKSQCVKVEPATNGPLYTEIHAYQRLGTADAIAAFKKKHKLQHVGMPTCIAFGRHDECKPPVRFLIVPKFIGGDVEHLLQAHKALRPPVAANIAEQCVRTLQYMHESAFSHADVKAENLLAAHAYKRPEDALWMLTDFGLCKRVSNPVYKEDKRHAHEGTLQFASIDAHKGAGPSFRGDVQSLLFNVLYWINGSLPWFNETDGAKVLCAKQQLLSGPASYLSELLGDAATVKCLAKAFAIVGQAQFDQLPDYNAMIKELRALAKCTLAADTGGGKATPKRRAKQRLATSDDEDDTDGDDAAHSPSPRPAASARKAKERRTPAASGSGRRAAPAAAATSADASPLREHNAKIPGLSKWGGQRWLASRALVRSARRSVATRHTDTSPAGSSSPRGRVVAAGRVRKPQAAKRTGAKRVRRANVPKETVACQTTPGLATAAASAAARRPPKAAAAARRR